MELPPPGAPAVRLLDGAGPSRQRRGPPRGSLCLGAEVLARQAGLHRPPRDGRGGRGGPGRLRGLLPRGGLEGGQRRGRPSRRGCRGGGRRRRRRPGEGGLRGRQGRLRGGRQGRRAGAGGEVGPLAAPARDAGPARDPDEVRQRRLPVQRLLLLLLRRPGHLARGLLRQGGAQVRQRAGDLDQAGRAPSPHPERLGEEAVVPPRCPAPGRPPALAALHLRRGRWFWGSGHQGDHPGGGAPVSGINTFGNN